MRRKRHSHHLLSLLSTLQLIVISMLASRSRGASSAILARWNGRTGGRCRSILGIGGIGAHHDGGFGRHKSSGRNEAFIGIQSSSQSGATTRANLPVFRQPSFLASSIIQQLRGGDSNDVSVRNNSTSATNNNNNNNSTPSDPNNAWRKAYVAVGANLGDRYENIASALSDLEANRNGTIRVIRTSYLRMTSPMYVTDQPAFLNGAVEIETTLSPLDLLKALKEAESGLGRDVGPDSTAQRFGPRPVDLDILLFDGYEVANPDGTPAETLGDNDVIGNSLVMHTEILEIPHPRMMEREFVLSPMNDLERAAYGAVSDGDGGIVHPVSNETMGDLLQSLLRQSNNETNNDEDAVRVLPLPRNRMLCFNQTLIMGILNVTPDSFSDGGKYSSSIDLAAEQALQLEKDGADIIDIGGESTRPGAEEVAIEEELQRVIPVIERIRQENADIVISIDTRHSSVAKAAIEAGADIVNDISGGTHDAKMLKCVASMGVPMVIMHMRGTPKTMQSLTNYGDGDENDGVVAVVAQELMQRSSAAEEMGIPRWLQVLDAGIGFAKDMDGNLSLLKGANSIRKRCDNLPFLSGSSRKGFIGKIAGVDKPEERDYGTIAACLASIASDGDSTDACNVLRVHNVKAVKQAVLVYEAIQNAKQ